MSATRLTTWILLLTGRSMRSLAFDRLMTSPAAKAGFWQAKVFVVVWVVGMLSILFYWLTHPAILRRRMRNGFSGEPDVKQRIIVSALVVCILALFAVSVVDLLHGWSRVPVVVVVIGDALVVLGLALLNVVFRVNEFAAATIQVESGQTVASTGPYALIRHPMYSAGLLMFLGAPVSLGSWWGLLLFPPVTALIIARLKNEERYLANHLPGYRDYCAKVTHRLIPGVW